MNLDRDPQATSKAAIKQVAQNWNELSYNYSKPGEYTAYDEMAQEFLSRVKHEAESSFVENDPNQLVEHGGAYAGFNVVGRFLYAGAVHAVKDGFTQEQLREAFFKPASFRSLQLLTREWNDSAKEIEYELGLSGVLYPNDDRTTKGFTLDRDLGLTINLYPILSYRARKLLVDREKLSSEEAFAQSPEKSTIRCLAHSAGVLTYVYKFMIDVADKDSSLFERTFALTDSAST